MAIDVEAACNAWRAARRPKRVISLAALSLPALVALLPISGVAQDTPWPTPTPNLLSPPSLPVGGPRVRSTPIPPGAKVPTPGVVWQHEHMMGIPINGEDFVMHPGPCALPVNAAILAHEDLFTGDKSCDALILQARTMQRRKEAEDPSYANEPRITPRPTPAESGDDQIHR